MGAEGLHFVDGEADEHVVVLHDSEQLQGKAAQMVAAEEEVLEVDVLVLHALLLLGRHLLRVELEIFGVIMGDGLVVVGVSEEDGTQILLDHGQEVLLRHLGPAAVQMHGQFNLDYKYSFVNLLWPSSSHK